MKKYCLVSQESFLGKKMLSSYLQNAEWGKNFPKKSETPAICPKKMSLSSLDDTFIYEPGKFEPQEVLLKMDF